MREVLAFLTIPFRALFCVLTFIVMQASEPYSGRKWYWKRGILYGLDDFIGDDPPDPDVRGLVDATRFQKSRRQSQNQ